MNRIFLYSLTALVLHAACGRSAELVESPWQISLASTVFNEEREVFLHYSGGGFIRSRWLHDKHARQHELLHALKERGSDDYSLRTLASAYDFVPLTLEPASKNELATMLPEAVQQIESWHKQTPARYAVEDGATITLLLDVGSELRTYQLGPTEYSQEFTAFVNRLHSILPVNVPLLDEIIAGQLKLKKLIKDQEAQPSGP